jgi:hypothetical protein
MEHAKINMFRIGGKWNAHCALPDWELGVFVIRVLANGNGDYVSKAVAKKMCAGVSIRLRS